MESKGKNVSNGTKKVHEQNLFQNRAKNVLKWKSCSKWKNQCFLFFLTLFTAMCSLLRDCMVFYGLFMVLYDLFIVIYGLLWQVFYLIGLVLFFLVVIDPNSFGLVFFRLIVLQLDKNRSRQVQRRRNLVYFIISFQKYFSKYKEQIKIWLLQILKLSKRKHYSISPIKLFRCLR